MEVWEKIFRLEDCEQWSSVGSVLGSLLLVRYINDLDKDVDGLVSMFAHDTKIAGVVDY